MTFVRASRSRNLASSVWPIAVDTVSAFAASVRRHAAAEDDLEEARELLAYWERRARRLPRWSVIRRREARAMARVWRERVADGERLRYGAGLLGAVTLYAAERRMPTRASHRGRQAARVAAWTVVATAVAMLVIVATFLVAFADAVISLL